jgi:sterol 3beta-glucosyltransferase
MSVKIAIPYPAILDVEKSSAMDFTETIEVKVFDKQEHFSVDSYFFAYFKDLPTALKQIRDAIFAACTRSANESPQLVVDTTMSRLPHMAVERAHSQPLPEPSPRSASAGSRFSSLFRPFQDTISFGRTTTSLTHISDTPTPRSDISDEFTHILKRGNIAFTNSPKSQGDALSESQHSRQGSAKNPTPAVSRHDHTYPPSTTHVDPSRIGISSQHYSWSPGVPSWLRDRVLGNPLPHAAVSPANPTAVFEVYSSNSGSPSKYGGTTDLGFSILETPDALVDLEVTEKFRNTFAFDDREPLFGCTLFCLYGSSLIADGALTRFPWLPFPNVARVWQVIRLCQLSLFQGDWPFDIKDASKLFGFDKIGSYDELDGYAYPRHPGCREVKSHPLRSPRPYCDRKGS